jgi:pimeloyl-ACP methyl ester carboxylesterase
VRRSDETLVGIDTEGEPMAIEHLSVDGTDLAYRVDGAGSPALAFVHGWLSRLDHWDAQAEPFASDHRVVRWDRRGMSRSANGPTADSPQRHADDLAAILDHEGIGSVVVVGHAGGGPTALTFAASYPERTDGLAMVDSRVYTPAEGRDSDPLLATVDRLAAGLEADGAADFLAPVYASFFGRLAPADVVTAAVENAQATDPAVAVSELRHTIGVGGPTTRSLAGQVRCPVLWVSADPTDTAYVTTVFPQADGEVQVGHVVGSGHFVQLEVPDQLNALLATFIASL